VLLIWGQEESVPFEMLDVGPPLTDARVATFERQLGIGLPKSYRSFLLRYNGGRPEPEFFPIHGYERDASGGVHYFFGLDDPIESSNIDWNYRMYLGRMPSELLPIAGDGSGNIICLSLTGANQEAVYFWDHDREYSPPGYDNVYFVAESFTKFLDSMYFEDLTEEIAKSLGKPF
jgi:hypothetical protein